MQLTCPGCGFCAPLDVFCGDVDARHIAELMGRCPPSLSDQVLRYIGLFAPAKHKLTVGRARRVLEGLIPLIVAGEIRRKGRSWPVPVDLWTQALADILERRSQLTLPLRSHGYLLEIVTGLADKAEAAAESAHEAALKTRLKAAQHDGAPPPVPRLRQVDADGNPLAPGQRPDETQAAYFARKRQEWK